MSLGTNTRIQYIYIYTHIYVHIHTYSLQYGEAGGAKIKKN